MAYCTALPRGLLGWHDQLFHHPRCHGGCSLSDPAFGNSPGDDVEKEWQLQGFLKGISTFMAWREIKTGTYVVLTNIFRGSPTFRFRGFHPILGESLKGPGLIIAFQLKMASTLVGKNHICGTDLLDQVRESSYMNPIYQRQLHLRRRS